MWQPSRYDEHKELRRRSSVVLRLGREAARVRDGANVPLPFFFAFVLLLNVNDNGGRQSHPTSGLMAANLLRKELADWDATLCVGMVVEMQP